ncbi:glycosyltransferase family 4 protein [Halomonas organivorans]|uniref:Glycosyltransferase involved in cell wall biosynthesis n=1 Tax=Halomonas organivorans TaxID=257772 RepID=A0A7W5C1T9_9GAMM|nr:glycosyltransferase family 4 protein [Halomonas organivorans]MBB3143041.1 glycosyltransferase involved in cell wall biosynthesis [Halomonas organivorans]
MRPKVMQLCLSNGWGGLEMYPARIIPELARQGWEAHGLALAGSRVAASLEAAGVTPLTMASRGQALWRVGSILAYLKAHGIEVIHCHKSSDLRLGALLATLRPGLRLFFTDHMGVTRPKRDPYHRWAYGRVTRLFSISEATRARNLRAFPLPAERIRRLYLGIDPAPYVEGLCEGECASLRAELGVPEGAVAIGLPGRITPGKGQRVWVEALARLAERAETGGLASAWHGVVIGGLGAEEGSNAAFVEELRMRIQALGLDARITFSGFRADLPRCLQALDIVCTPSRNEAFGLTVIEAMAAGRPVVGASSGAIPELVSPDTGRLAAPESPEAWAAALAELVDDGALRERLGAAGRKRVLDDFTLAHHVAALVAEYAGQPSREEA